MHLEDGRVTIKDLYAHQVIPLRRGEVLPSGLVDQVRPPLTDDDLAPLELFDFVLT